MGTRADFYVGRGEKAEWVGSIAFDGYPEGIDTPVLRAPTERRFRNAIKRMLDRSDSNTKPEQGWPWPWEDSRTTDFAYAFDKGKVWVSSFGDRWLTIPQRLKADRRGEDLPKEATFPDMTKVQNVTLGKRSGLIVITA